MASIISLQDMGLPVSPRTLAAASKALSFGAFASPWVFLALESSLGYSGYRNSTNRPSLLTTPATPLPLVLAEPVLPEGLPFSS